MKLPKVVQKAGFTMIELLVVIAVIGVLAVAVLSSINPIEQINKGRDTRTRSDAAQLINATDRYFSIHEMYPWNYSSPTYDPDPALEGKDNFDAEFHFDGTDDGADWNWIDVLESTAEVKGGYVDRIKRQQELYIYKDGSENATMYTCFLPASEAFKQEAALNCDEDMTPGSANSGVTIAGDPLCSARDDVDPDDDNYICLP